MKLYFILYIIITFGTIITIGLILKDISGDMFKKDLKNK
jgi:hypothetical protein